MPSPLTAAAYATTEIKRLIIERELPPGERIDQTEMANRLGVSRIPIRQALLQLAERNFVVLRDHRGATVAPISIEDMRDLYAVRWHLEEWAFRQFFHRFDAKRIADLELLVEQTSALAQGGDLGQFTELNREFHLTLYGAVPNEYLRTELVRLFDLSERYHWACLNDRDTRTYSHNEHHELIECIKAEDLRGFLALCKDHNDKTIDWVVRKR